MVLLTTNSAMLQQLLRTENLQLQSLIKGGLIVHGLCSTQRFRVVRQGSQTSKNYMIGIKLNNNMKKDIKLRGRIGKIFPSALP